MDNQINNTNAVFMELTSKKMELQDNKIAYLEEKLNTLPDNSKSIEQMISKMDELQKNVIASVFPEKKLTDFCKRMDDGINVLKVPVQNKVQHHHHFSKLIWITAGLFIVLSLVCAGWYSTGEKLERYITNDTKYRYLKLNADQALQMYLNQVDSFHNTNLNMRKDVLSGEDQQRHNFERLQKAEALKAEANELEKGIKKEELHIKPPKKNENK